MTPFITAPAPIIQCFPILVPGNIIAPAPIKVFSSILTDLKAYSTVF